MFGRKKKQIPLPPAVGKTPPKASPQTKKAIRFFNGKISAIDLIEPDKHEKFQFTNYTKTLNDKLFEFIENKKLWQGVALAIAVAFVTAVMYWGIKQ
jgi:hypothetical protein